MRHERRVRRLSLSATEDRSFSRATALIEDALRTATLPSAPPGHVLVVRRLDLGVISTRRPSQAIALRIAERMRAIAASSVPFDAPHAGAASAVIFPSAPEARAAFAIRLAIGPAPSEWFWPAAVPEWRPGASLEASLPALLSPSRGRSSEPDLVFRARWVESLVRMGGAEAVLAHLPVSIARLGLAMHPHPRSPAVRVALPPRWKSLLRWSIQRWTRDDPRAHWIARCAVVALRPELAASPLLSIAAAASLDEVARPRVVATAHRPERAARPVSLPLAGRALSDAVAETRPEPPPITDEPAPSPRAEERVERPASTELAPGASSIEPSRVAPDTAEPAEPDADRRAEPRSWLEPSGAPWPEVPLLEGSAPTALGGLVFLLPPLRWLGLERTFDDEPALVASAFGWRVLARLVEQLGADPMDPMLWALAPGVAPEPMVAAPFVAPSRWWQELCIEDVLTLHEAGELGQLVRASERDLWIGLGDAAREPLSARLDGRVVEHGEPRPALVTDRCDGWAAALERVCTRRLGLALDSVVRRKAVVAASRTHVDVLLPASAVEIAIRRHALDASPGWVPWLGRIVEVHYVDDAELARMVAAPNRRDPSRRDPSRRDPPR